MKLDKLYKNFKYCFKIFKIHLILELFMDLYLESLELFLNFYALGIAFFSFKFMISIFWQFFFSFFLEFSLFSIFSQKESRSCKKLYLKDNLKIIMLVRGD